MSSSTWRELGVGVLVVVGDRARRVLGADSMVHAAHDALFRRLFADREIAAAAIAATLPSEVAARIDFATLELQPASHVDEALHAFHSDLVFSARIAGRDARVLLLLEHQSSAETLMPFRLLQYAVNLWDAYVRDHPGTQRLPVILPVVWHQGPSEWRAPREMLEVLDLTDEERAVLGRYAPRMRFELEEIGLLTDEALRARHMPAEATLALAALRDVRHSSDVPAMLRGWAELARAAKQTDGGTRALATVLRYILDVHDDLDVDELRKVVEEIVHGAGASIMATAHELIERGRAEGKAEGEARGRAEGEARGRRATLVRMFRLKFQGAFTVAMQARVEGADDAALDQWEERILTAATIDDVLG